MGCTYLHGDLLLAVSSHHSLHRRRIDGRVVYQCTQVLQFRRINVVPSSKPLKVPLRSCDFAFVEEVAEASCENVVVYRLLRACLDLGLPTRLVDVFGEVGCLWETVKPVVVVDTMLLLTGW